MAEHTIATEPDGLIVLSISLAVFTIATLVGTGAGLDFTTATVAASATASLPFIAALALHRIHGTT